MNKLCLFLNYDPHYREPIYRLMDKEWDCVWRFGKQDLGIRRIGLDVFKTAEYTNVYGNRILYQAGWWRLLRNKEIHAIIATGQPFNLSLWLLLLFRPMFSHNKKIYTWGHGFYGRENRLKTAIKRLLFNLCDGEFVYGNLARERMIAIGFKPEKVWTIHNSLNHAEQKKIRESLRPTALYKEHFGNNLPNLIFIGRITPVKKLHLIVEAMRLMRKQGQDVNFTIIGGGDTSELQSLLEQYGIGANVWFYGPCYDEKKNAELIYNADVCVAPGNIGLTAIHSLTYGTPIITHSNLPNQMPEVEVLIPGITGEYFDEDSVTSLAEAIYRILKLSVNRENTRHACYNIIDSQWTPEYQMSILRQVLNPVQ